MPISIDPTTYDMTIDFHFNGRMQKMVGEFINRTAGNCFREIRAEKIDGGRILGDNEFVGKYSYRVDKAYIVAPNGTFGTLAGCVLIPEPFYTNTTKGGRYEIRVESSRGVFEMTLKAGDKGKMTVNIYAKETDGNVIRRREQWSTADYDEIDSKLRDVEIRICWPVIRNGYAFPPLNRNE